MNLGVLAGGTMYVQLAGKAQSALAYTLRSAFTQFVVIVFIHGIICLKETQLVCKLCHVVRPQAANPADYERLPNA